jgi:alpha-L-rhamnosidase
MKYTNTLRLATCLGTATALLCGHAGGQATASDNSGRQPAPKASNPIAANTPAPLQLRCEYLTDPSGIDVVKPRLSWVIGGPNPAISNSKSTIQNPQLDLPRGRKQVAYQVLVASTADLLKQDTGDLWDSGKVASAQSNQIEYAGKPLESRVVCQWKVRVWLNAGMASEWSQPAVWSMGLLKPTDWQARWIGYDAAYQPAAGAAADLKLFNIQGLKWMQMPARQGNVSVDTCLRKRVEVPADRQLRRAVLACYAFNICKVTVNGTAIGQGAHWERTAWLDATKALHPGANVVTLLASQTDPHLPAVIGRLVLQFDSGADLVLPIDQTWKISQTPAAGWEQVDYDDTTWATAEATGQPWQGPPPVADLARMPAPYLRKDFTLGQAVKRATAYVTALGTYELRLNGQRVSQDLLAPGWTEFRKRVHYQTYDVTQQLAQGQNTIAAILGDGWYASDLAHLARRNIYGGNPRLLAQLVIELADGSTQVVASDESWKASYGPILHADLLMGCEYDARRGMPGWDKAGFNAANWQPVVVDGEPKNIRIQASVAEPSRAINELPALKLTEPRPGCWTFDLGQNMVGWVRLKIIGGTAGQRLTVRHGEMLNADGTLYTAALRSCPATDFYQLSGSAEEILSPYFTFHGFRYVEVRGLTKKPDLSAITGIVVHTPMRRTGTFECSSPPLNQLYSNIIWGQKGNYLEIPTDCPQRDERMGWTGDTQFFATTAAYNFDVAAFFTRWLQTCEDNQNPNGTFPHVVPDIMGDGGATAWGDAALICTYNIYRAYGDTRVVAERYAAMERYMRWLDSKTTNGISSVGGFGDWLNAGGGAKKEAIDTAYHAHLARIMAEMATAIGRDADAQRYTALHATVKNAFARQFLLADGSLKDCSQTGYALAFSMDLLPTEMRDKVAARFVDEIKRFNWHLATGFIGTPRLLPALSAAGRDDVAYRLLLTDTYPSWLFPVKNGATTMWERWNGWTPDKGFGDVKMNSFNHYAFGAVGEYLYGGVGGIQAASPGYKTITIKPAIGAGLTWAKTAFDSIHGRIASNWQREGGKLTLDVTIPANTSATIHVPTTDQPGVTESGKPSGTADGVKFLRMDNGAAVYAVDSGIYHFQSAFPEPAE